MDIVIPYLIAFMAIIGIFMIGKYLYRKLYLRKFVLKDLTDINDSYSALVKSHNRLVEHLELQEKIVSALHKLVKEQSSFQHDLTDSMVRFDARIKELEKKTEIDKKPVDGETNG